MAVQSIHSWNIALFLKSNATKIGGMEGRGHTVVQSFSFPYLSIPVPASFCLFWFPALCPRFFHCKIICKVDCNFFLFSPVPLPILIILDASHPLPHLEVTRATIQAMDSINNHCITKVEGDNYGHLPFHKSERFTKYPSLITDTEA